MDESNLKVLTQVQDPELDEYYDEIDFDEEKSLMFDEFNILDCIGPDYIASNSFFTTYSMSIDKIKSSSVHEQKVFCIEILTHVSEKFDFKFIRTPQLENQEDFNSVYEFIYFLHISFTEYIHILLDQYDYKQIMQNVIDGEFLRKNSNIIFNKIPEVIKILNKTEDILIRQFLLYDNESIYNIISTHVRENKTVIASNLINAEGEE